MHPFQLNDSGAARRPRAMYLRSVVRPGLSPASGPRRKRFPALIAALLIMATLACGAISTPPPPTASPRPTNTPVIPTPTPTEPPPPKGLLAFSSLRDGNADIYLIQAETGEAVRLTNHPSGDYTPSWSPDGTRIAFSSDRNGNQDIYVMNWDGSGLLRLTSDPASEGSPVWSPDGKRIAFTFESEREGNIEIYVMNADGSDPKRLTEDPADDAWFAWSPDGSRIAFMSLRSGQGDIYVMNADGSQVSQLTGNPLLDSFPAWSPDGARIAFAVQSPDDPADIFVMNADGTGLTRLTDNPAGDVQPTWSPEGQHITFVSDRDGNAELYIMGADGSNVTRLTNIESLDANPAWAPRGVTALPPSRAEVDRYYPYWENSVQWYVVKRQDNGEQVDVVSFAHVGSGVLADGTVVYLVENTFSNGVALDYQAITPQHVYLHRFIAANVSPSLVTDSTFTPPLAYLEFPLNVGKTWAGQIAASGVAKSYEYRVEEQMDVTVNNTTFKDCYRVVRLSDGTPDYKTEYCPGLGVAAYEFLHQEVGWLRGEWIGFTNARLFLKTLYLDTDGRCAFFFSGAGFPTGEQVSMKLSPPQGEPMSTSGVPVDDIVVAIPPDAPQGNWLLTVEDQQHSAWFIIRWQNKCSARFFATYPPAGPSLTLMGAQANDLGGLTYGFGVTGWKAGETLTFKAEGPASPTQTIDLGQQDETGVTPLIGIPFVQNPADGDYTFTTIGEAAEATVVLVCKDGYCELKQD